MAEQLLLLRFSGLFHVYLIVQFLMFLVSRKWLLRRKMSRRCNLLLTITILELALWLSILAILFAVGQIVDLFGDNPGAFIRHRFVLYVFGSWDLIQSHPWGILIVLAISALPVIVNLIYERKKWWAFNFVGQFLTIYFITLFVYFKLWYLLFDTSRWLY